MAHFAALNTHPVHICPDHDYDNTFRNLFNLINAATASLSEMESQKNCINPKLVDYIKNQTIQAIQENKKTKFESPANSATRDLAKELMKGRGSLIYNNTGCYEIKNILLYVIILLLGIYLILISKNVDNDLKNCWKYKILLFLGRLLVIIALYLLIFY